MKYNVSDKVYLGLKQLAWDEIKGDCYAAGSGLKQTGTHLVPQGRIVGMPV